MSTPKDTGQHPFFNSAHIRIYTLFPVTVFTLLPLGQRGYSMSSVL